MPKKSRSKRATATKAKTKTGPKRSMSKPVRRPAARRAPPRKLAAFTRQVLAEEQEPVAVRSFVEARAGASGQKELLPATGEVRPVATAPAPAPRASEPRLDPLTGPLAVPKTRSEEFKVKEPSRRSRKGETTEDFGPVELRQATASGGKMLTRAKAENLQRGAERIRALASADRASPAARKTDRLTVPPAAANAGAGGRGGRDPAELMDFGDVEIAQQTRSGARKVGKLESRKKTADDES